MKVPIRWLKEYIDIDISPEELAKTLTMSGLEISAIEYHGGDISNVVVGQIKSIDKHPNADRLTVVQIDAGQEEPLQIVTGAPNINIGDKVPVALNKATLANDMKIVNSKLRGVESFGMLCSIKELGIGEEAGGILILPEDAPIGQDIKDVLGMGGATLEAEVLPNRPDLLSVIGISREVAALLDKHLKMPEIKIVEGEEKIEDIASVEVQDFEKCPRYMARVIKGIKVQESPDWLKSHLLAAGQRPINNIVDITNFVLLELGQPLHAFDLNFIKGNKIIVRTAHDKEKITTLDEKEHELHNNNLLICDTERGVALAGIMGGQNSEVKAETQDILLESAYFNPKSVYHTSKELKLFSESSIRFSRGVDWKTVELALDRAAALIAELGGGTIAKGKIDIKQEEKNPSVLDLRYQRVTKILGVEVPESSCKQILTRLGFNIIEENQDGLKIEIPLFRSNDIEREIDLIEEVARIYGYDKIPETLPAISMKNSYLRAEEKLEESIRDVLRGCGLTELNTFSLVNKKDLALLGDDYEKNALPLANPLTEESAVLRTTPLPSIFEYITHNLNHQNKDLNAFEIGKIFNKRDNDLPEEKKLVYGVLCGQIEKEIWDTNKRKPIDKFYYLKNIIESMFEELAIKQYSLKQSQNPIFHPGKSADLSVDNKAVVSFGEINPILAKKFDITEDVYYFEIDFDALLSTTSKIAKFSSLSQFPRSVRDLSFVVPENVTCEDIKEEIKKNGGKLLKEVEVFDCYQGEQIKEGTCSLSFNLTFEDKEKTLKDKEVDKITDKIMKQLLAKHKVDIRR